MSLAYNVHFNIITSPLLLSKIKWMDGRMNGWMDEWLEQWMEDVWQYDEFGSGWEG